MNDHNSVRVTGWLARDAEIRYSHSGTPMTFLNLDVASGEGDSRQHCWIDVKVFGEQVKRFDGALKGSRVCVMGRLVQDSWDDKQTGAKRYKHAIHADAAFLIAEKKADEAPKKAKPAKAARKQGSLPTQAEDDSVGLVDGHGVIGGTDYGDIPF